MSMEAHPVPLLSEVAAFFPQKKPAICWMPCRKVTKNINLISETNHAGKEGEINMSFKSVQKGIAKKEGIPMKNAGAILANASRKASPAAKRANPNLRKVK